MKVGYLGPKGTFSSEACNICFKGHEKIPYKTIKETILALKEGKIDKAIVPIENSLQGCVTETVDTLIQNDKIFVISEYILEIKQNLMSKKNIDKSNIKVLYSHPQAIAQCRTYIERNLKNAEIVEVASTAIGAKMTLENANSACIVNIDCIKEYNLKLINKNIQDNDTNKTKFWILKKELENMNEKSKMSIIFSTSHTPGALYKMLGIFDKYGINLTKIESRPTKEKLGEYYFLVDFDIENKAKKVENTLLELEKTARYYRILGVY